MPASSSTIKIVIGMLQTARGSDHAGAQVPAAVLFKPTGAARHGICWLAVSFADCSSYIEHPVSEKVTTFVLPLRADWPVTALRINFIVPQRIAPECRGTPRARASSADVIPHHVMWSCIKSFPWQHCIKS